MSAPRQSLVLGLDAVGAKYGGAATVALGAARAALDSERVRQLVVWSSPREQRRFDFPDDDRLLEIEQGSAETSGAARVHWQAIGLPGEARRRAVDVLLCLGGGGAPPRGIPGATLIQQSLPFSKEALSRCPARLRHRMKVIRLCMRYSCLRNDLVIVQTPTMRDWVTRSFRLADGKVEVITPGVSKMAPDHAASSELAPMRNAAPGARLLYVGNGLAYKNIGVILAAWPMIRERVPDASLFMTLPADAKECRAPGSFGVGYLDSLALSEAYRLATLLVMPSLVETVGLPMLEAIAEGTPVVAADRPYARDVLGSAGTFFDPENPGDLAGTVVGLLQNEARRARLVQEGLRRGAELVATRPYARMVDQLLALAR